MVMVPATVSNNVPGSDLSIGADTALNAITHVSAVGCPAHSYTSQAEQGLLFHFTSSRPSVNQPFANHLYNYTKNYNKKNAMLS